jgi:hypothetical protein
MPSSMDRRFGRVFAIFERKNSMLRSWTLRLGIGEILMVESNPSWNLDTTAGTIVKYVVMEEICWP